jgi:hypothetical protein
MRGSGEGDGVLERPTRSSVADGTRRSADPALLSCSMFNDLPDEPPGTTVAQVRPVVVVPGGVFQDRLIEASSVLLH